MAFIVKLNNSAGEIDRRKVVTEDQTKAAVLEMVEAADHLCDGDSITIEEVAD